MSKSLNIIAVNALRQRIIETVLYFEIFSYPMTRKEIFWAVGEASHSPDQINETIDKMVSEGVVFEKENFISAAQDNGAVSARKESNHRAEKYLKIAYRIGRFINGFPYVRSVMISGSLAKNSMAKDGDIDFFIITRPGRLWICRTMLILFKKLFLFNSHKYFCVNYFIDTEHLVIEERNRFTATEIATLKPVVGRNIYREFIDANHWITDFYPNYPKANPESIRKVRNRGGKWLFERLLNTRLGEYLDQLCMKLTIKRWSKKFPDMPKPDFDVALKSREYVSKHHPNHFQQKVLNAFAQKMIDFEKRTSIGLDLSKIRQPFNGEQV